MRWLVTYTETRNARTLGAFTTQLENGVTAWHRAVTAALGGRSPATLGGTRAT